MKKNKQEEFIDDGRTIAPMDIEGMPRKVLFNKKTNKRKEYDVTKSEKRALILAAYKAALPVLLCGIVGFGLTILLIMWWLN